MRHSGVLFVISVFAFAGTATAASTLYAATKDGPFKSMDSGVTWTLLTVTSNDSSLPGEPEIFAMAVDPQNPSTVYAFARFTASPSGELLAFLKSTDAGVDWSVVWKPSFSYTFGTAASLAIDPVKTNVLYTMYASNGLEAHYPRRWRLAHSSHDRRRHIAGWDHPLGPPIARKRSSL